MPNVSPVIVLREIASARAARFRACHIVDLEEAIAPLYSWALDHGVIDMLGAADTMRLIYAAFDLPPDGSVPPDHPYIESADQQASELQRAPVGGRRGRANADVTSSKLLSGRATNIERAS
jgi:hypothetical protein